MLSYGFHELYQAYQANFEEHLKRDQMSSKLKSWITNGGCFGLAARGGVIGLVGVILIVAAPQFDPSEATGLGGALHTLLQQPFGPWLLGVVACGLLAYGLLIVAVARFGRITPESLLEEPRRAPKSALREVE